jgi:hypothetical protein
MCQLTHTSFAKKEVKNMVLIKPRFIMRWCLLLVTTLSLMAALPAGAQALPEQTFLPNQQLGYKPVKPALKALASTQKSKTKLQHFCVIGYLLERPADAPSSKIAWVYWKEQNSLIYWESAAPGSQSADTLINSRRQLDLAQDVVATQAEVGSSSYLVTRGWVDSVLKDCQKRGVSYALNNR